MSMVFWLFLAFVLLLRFAEMWLARRNERWLRRHGAVEFGRDHYPWIVGLHALFFVSLVVEYLVRGTGYYSIPLLIAYFVLVAFKAWTVLSLGRFWNTRIFRIPGCPLVRRGPYRFLKHPNYGIVIVEIALIPLIFHLWFTAAVFTLLDAAVLWVRIRVENRALTV